MDLQGCRSTLDLNLVRCRLLDNFSLQDANIGALYLRGSCCEQTLDLPRLTVARDVHLRDGFQAMELVDLRNARVGGQLVCDDSKFLAATGLLLDCEAAEIGADLFLRGKVEAKGPVDFSRVSVAGNLRVSPYGEKNPRLEAGIDLEGARIGGGLFWKSVTGARRFVDLTEARVGSLRDDWAAWDAVGEVKLDGFTYDRVEGSMSVAQRLEWLDRACCSMDRPVDIAPGFDPQPHVHLATVLRAQGNRDGAARVLVDREKRQWRAERARGEARLDGTWRVAFASLKDDAKA